MVARSEIEQCDSCNNRGVFSCPRCDGRARVFQMRGMVKTEYICAVCQGRGYLECPFCYEAKVDKHMDKLKEHIQKLGFMAQDSRKLSAILENLCRNNRIRYYIDKGQRVSALMRRNRHDLYHALRVTSYAVDLFKHLCIPPESALFGTTHCPAKALEIVLVSAFCHDLKRGYDSHASVGSLTIRDFVAEVYGDMNISLDEKIIDDIEGCIYCHSGNEKVPPFIEYAIVTVADGLDCGRHRVQPYIDESLVMKEDLKPMEYFSNVGVDTVEVKKVDENRVQFQFDLHDPSGIKPALDLLARIKNTILDYPKNREHFELIAKCSEWRVFGWQKDSIRIWP